MKFLGELDVVSWNRTQSCNLKLTDPERLQAIRDTGLMDTPREEAFDRLASLAAKILGVPLTIVSIVDSKKQFFKADFGLPSPFNETRELPIDASLCRYTLTGQPIISSDAFADPFLKLHPSTGPWGIGAIIVLPLITEKGHVLGTFCAIEPKAREWTELDLEVMRELTASIMTEINLRNRISLLKTEQKLRETFVAALTHDLRTPLSAAKLNAQLLARRHPELAAVQSAATKIGRSLDRSERMIQDLLDASQITSGKSVPLKLNPCNLREIASQALHDLTEVHSDRFVLKAEGEFSMVADAKALRRIIENLASNAAKYGAPETPIEISLRAVGDQVKLEVRNEGNPIPEADLANIFEPFHRTRSATTSSQQGWGLGLPLVRGFAEAHGGSVSVFTDPGKRTCFSVSLPFQPSRRVPDSTSV